MNTLAWYTCRIDQHNINTLAGPVRSLKRAYARGAPKSPPLKALQQISMLRHIAYVHNKAYK